MQGNWETLEVLPSHNLIYVPESNKARTHLKSLSSTDITFGSRIGDVGNINQKCKTYIPPEEDDVIPKRADQSKCLGVYGDRGTGMRGSFEVLRINF
jgi:hypothetical protein